MRLGFYTLFLAVAADTVHKLGLTLVTRRKTTPERTKPRNLPSFISASIQRYLHSKIYCMRLNVWGDCTSARQIAGHSFFLCEIADNLFLHLERVFAAIN